MKPKIYISIPSNSNVWKEYSKTFIDAILGRFPRFEISTRWMTKDSYEDELEHTDILIMLSASPRSCFDLGYFCGICASEIDSNGFTNKLVIGLNDGIAVNPEIFDCIDKYGRFCETAEEVLGILGDFLERYQRGTKAKKCLECENDAKCRGAEMKGQVTSCPCLECLDNCDGCAQKEKKK